MCTYTTDFTPEIESENPNRPIPEFLFTWLTRFHPTGAKLWNTPDWSIDHTIRLIDFALVHANDRYDHRVDEETGVALNYVLSYWKHWAKKGEEVNPTGFRQILEDLIDDRAEYRKDQMLQQAMWRTGQRICAMKNKTNLYIRRALYEAGEPCSAEKVLLVLEEMQAFGVIDQSEMPNK